MTRRRLVLYLLLNALVSLLVSVTILYFYDRANRKTDCDPGGIAATNVPSGVAAEIISVASAGVLENESIVIQNQGDQALPLSGWTLKDSQGSIFTFPELTIYPGGSIQVHTKPGTDTAADLFWGRAEPVWQSGELAALYDSQNIARAFYRIP
jgi:hypothetical protein